MRRLLMRAHVGAEFQRAKVGTDDFEVNFPFVRKQNDEPTQVIKPLFLARTDSTRVLTHGGQWLDKVRRLRKRHALPAQVLFPVSVPDPQTRAFAAYEEIRTDLQQEGVQVVAATDEARILEFAAPEERDRPRQRSVASHRDCCPLAPLRLRPCAAPPAGRFWCRAHRPA